MDSPINPTLPDETLQRRTTLPLKPDPVTLRGQTVVLRPLSLADDLDALYAVSNGSPIVLGARSIEAYDQDAVIWRYMAAGPFATQDAMAGYLRGLAEARDMLCLCVLDAPTQHPVGVTTYMSHQPQHLKIELGHIWYSPIAQRTQANTEAAYLMLKHAFELGYRRVEWKCDALNERSRRAALRLGFTFEGIQAFHLIIKGRNRDTAWFRMLDYEWDERCRALEEMLYPAAAAAGA